MTTKKVTFGKIFWPSLVAVLVTSIIGLVLFFLIVGGIVGGLAPESKSVTPEANTVLHMQLDGVVAEKGETQLNPGSFQVDTRMGLSDILYGLKKAKENDNVKGIYLELGNFSCGISTAREIRKAINDFEESGKFVIAYNNGELISLRKYYVASAADEVYGFPTSAMEFMGLGAELMFFKNTLDMLDVEMQVIRGKNNDFKSAVEPYFLDKMSDSSRMQMERYLDGLWTDIKKDIAKDRKIAVAELDSIAEQVKIRRAEDAVALQLLDAVIYSDQVMQKIAEKVGVEKVEDVQLQKFYKYAHKQFLDDQILIQEESPNIAVILAKGGIAVGGDGMSSKRICKLFREARENESVKTIVFRVNSPGGSALASDEIWREVKLTNETKKVIVSMGDVAASGGYYVSTPASAIFAEPTTITGSIGVFGVIPYTGKMMENKLGMTFDRVQTNSHSVMTTNRKLTEDEMSLIQSEVDDIYSDFLNRVAEGRGMSVENVNDIARGRVWIGRDALEIGLVDQLGGIQDAIDYAAKEAKIDDQKIVYYPKLKEDKFAIILEQLMEEQEVSINEVSVPEEFMKNYAKLKEVEKIQGIQMRLPYYVDFD